MGAMSLFNPSPRSALEYLPERHDLRSLEAAAARCQGCDLNQRATQVVFGAGRPFVGPAGLLLDKCLESAGIDRREVYVTNAVKHFILRMPEPEAKEAEIAYLVSDLKVAAQYVSAPRAK
jgi:uracil-DNA glycosylase